MKSFIKLPFHQLPLLQTGGRATSHFERTDPNDRNEWNSDDEDVDEFGRRKKRKIATRKSPQDSTEQAAAKEGVGEAFAKASDSLLQQQFPSSSSYSAYPMFPGFGQFGVPPKSGGMMPQMAADGLGFPRPQMPAVQQGLQHMQEMLQNMMSKNVSMPRPKAANWRPPVAEGAWNEPVQRPKFSAVRPSAVTMVPCQFFQQGTCARGDACMFLHTGKGAVADCKFFAMGQCSRGSACTLRHFRGFAPESSFVDFETGLPKGANVDKASKDTNVKPTKAVKSPSASSQRADDTGEQRVNMDEALEELLSMV